LELSVNSSIIDLYVQLANRDEHLTQKFVHYLDTEYSDVDPNELAEWSLVKFNFENIGHVIDQEEDWLGLCGPLVQGSSNSISQVVMNAYHAKQNPTSQKVYHQLSKSDKIKASIDGHVSKAMREARFSAKKMPNNTQINTKGYM